MASTYCLINVQFALAKEQQINEFDFFVVRMKINSAYRGMK